MTTINERERFRSCAFSFAHQAAEEQVSLISDPIKYARITEGRADWITASGELRQYSWCGDFVTFILERAGCRDGRALNRASINGAWRPGDNIARLLAYAKERGGLRTDFESMRPGDPIFWNYSGGGHIALFARWSSLNLGAFQSFDGNAGVNRSTAICSRSVKGGGPYGSDLTYFVDLDVLEINEHHPVPYNGQPTPADIADGGDGAAVSLW